MYIITYIYILVFWSKADCEDVALSINIYQAEWVTCPRIPMENPGIGCINHVTLEVEKMWLTLLKKKHGVYEDPCPGTGRRLKWCISIPIFKCHEWWELDWGNHPKYIHEYLILISEFILLILETIFQNYLHMIYIYIYICMCMYFMSSIC